MILFNSRFLSIAAIITIFSGCAAVTGHQNSMNEFDKKVLSNNCNFDDIQERVDNNSDKLLWSIQGASLARNCKDYTKSNSFFDGAEDTYKMEVDKDGMADNAMETAGSVLLNNNINDFEGNTYEKIMVNTYKALNYASLGDFEKANTELKRAYQRQQDAVRYFQDEINKQKKAQEKEEQEFQNKQDSKVENKFNSPTDILKSSQKDLGVIYNKSFAEFTPYADFVNPFTTYLSGLFALASNDFQDASTFLKRASEMENSSEQIKNDYALAKNLLEKNAQAKVGDNLWNKNYIWVIYENGLPSKPKEENIELPLFLVTDEIFSAQLSYPSLQEQGGSHNYLSVNGQNTEQIANMDRIIKSEFQKKFPSVMMQRVLSTILKSIMQQQANKKLGVAGGLASLAFQKATSSADVRSWTTLPKNFQATRIENIGEPVDIKNDKGEVIEQINDLPSNKNIILYIKSEVPQNNRIHKIVF